MPTAPDPPDLTGKPLDIETARNGDAVTIALFGELDIASIDGLESVLLAAEETEIGRIVIDLSELCFMDSNGLRVLLEFKKRKDGRLSFIPSRHQAVTRLLAVSGTAEMLDS